MLDETVQGSIEFRALARDDLRAAQGRFERALAGYAKLLMECEVGSLHQDLAEVALEKGDLGEARDHCAEALAIHERRDERWLAADTYRLFGKIARQEGDFVESGRWFVKSIVTYRSTCYEDSVQRITGEFRTTYELAPESDRGRLRSIWQQAELGAFPELTRPNDANS